jgi:hypothetical protein
MLVTGALETLASSVGRAVDVDMGTVTLGEGESVEVSVADDNRGLADPMLKGKQIQKDEAWDSKWDEAEVCTRGKGTVGLKGV